MAEARARARAVPLADLVHAAAWDAFEALCLAAFLAGLAVCAWPFVELP